MQILGTITGADHETQQLLLQSIDVADESSTHPMDSVMATIKTSHTVTLTGTTASTCLQTKDTMPAEQSCYIVGLGLDCKFIDLLIKRSINIFIKISLYLNFIVLEIISKQTDTLI